MLLMEVGGVLMWAELMVGGVLMWAEAMVVRTWVNPMVVGGDRKWAELLLVGRVQMAAECMAANGVRVKNLQPLGGDWIPDVGECYLMQCMSDSHLLQLSEVLLMPTWGQYMSFAAKPIAD